MSNSIRIKRRASDGATGAPTSLKNGELAYNEADDVLYYGYGVSGSNAAQIKGIGGGGLPATTLSNYVNLTTAQSVGGVKTLTSLLKPNAGINVNSGKFTVASSNGNTAIAGILGVTGVTTLTGALNANGGIAVDTDKFTVADTSGNVKTKGTLEVDGNTVLNGGLDFGGTVPAAAAAEGDIVVIHAGEVKTKSNANVLAAIGGAPAAGSANITTLGTITTGTWTATDIAVTHGGTGASTAAAAATNLGLGTGNSPGFTGLTLSGDLAVDGGDITSNAGTFNFLTDNASLEVLNIGDSGGNLATTFPGTVDIDSGLNVGSSNQFAVSSTGAITGTGANITALDADNISAGTVGAARLPVATSTAKGAIELFNDTAQSVAANSVTTTASRTYGIQLNSAGQAVVNVPWVDTNTNTNTTYDLSVPASTTKIRLAGSDSTNDDVEIFGGANVTVTRNSANKLTIASNAASTRDSLGIDTDDDVTLGTLAVGNITTTGYLRGPSSFTIDPATHGDNTGTLTIEGNLVVNGSTTTVSSTSIEIADKDLQLAKNTGLAQLTGAGLLLGQGSGGAEVSFIFEYNSGTNTQMVLSTGLKANGGLKSTTLTSCTIDGGTF